MSVVSTLRLNMTGHAARPEDEARRYQAAIDMAAYADANGFDAIGLEEHHCAENGWLPSPLLMAAMIAARTDNVQINVTALLITLYDPIRLAEDIAVLDLSSAGRFNFVAGLGYRPEEYHALGKDWGNRGKRMDETIETLLTAWRGEPFEYKGQTIRVTPVPVSRPHPPFFVGGMSKAAARRAARFALPFFPPMPIPELEALYYQEVQANGHAGNPSCFVYDISSQNTMLFVDHEPDRAWDELGPFFLRELQEYAGWKRDGVKRPLEDNVGSVEDLRKQGRFAILTPAQCLERLSAEGDHVAVLHPLAGGVPVDRAWNSLRLYVDDVLKPLNAITNT